MYNSVPRWFLPEKPKPLAPVVTRTQFNPDNTRLIRIIERTGSTFPTRLQLISKKVSNLQGSLVWPLSLFYGFYVKFFFFFIATKRLHPTATKEFVRPQSIQTSPGIQPATYSTGSSFFSPDVNDQHLRLTALHVFRLMSSTRRCGAVHRLMTRGLKTEENLTFFESIHSLFLYISNKMQRYTVYLSGNCSTCFGWYLHPSSGA
jgi:hypothetical protein